MFLLAHSTLIDNPGTGLSLRLWFPQTGLSIKICCHLVAISHNNNFETIADGHLMYINRACRAVSKKDLPSRNVLGEVIGKIFKIGQDFKKPFSVHKFNSHSFKKSHEKMSTLLNMREMQIKTSRKYHLVTVRMATDGNSTSNKCWRGCRAKGTLLH